MTPQTAFPLRLTGELDPKVSRWQWLFKLLLAIPHFIVLFVLWIGFVLSTVVAGVAILFTGRYPRRIFDFNVGVLRWSWRVGFYTYSALGTDKYPPFSLGDDPAYPARLEVDYPERLSRGLVLVKWWLLAIPHYLVVAVFTGGAWSAWSESGDGVLYATAGGLIGLLVLFGGLSLLFTGRYPRLALRPRHRPEPLGLPRRRLRGPDDRHLPAVPARQRQQRASCPGSDRDDEGCADHLAQREARLDEAGLPSADLAENGRGTQAVPYE